MMGFDCRHPRPFPKTSLGLTLPLRHHHQSDETNNTVANSWYCTTPLFATTWDRDPVPPDILTVWPISAYLPTCRPVSKVPDALSRDVPKLECFGRIFPPVPRPTVPFVPSSRRLIATWCPHPPGRTCLGLPKLSSAWPRRRLDDNPLDVLPYLRDLDCYRLLGRLRSIFDLDQTNSISWGSDCTVSNVGLSMVPN